MSSSSDLMLWRGKLATHMLALHAIIPNSPVMDFLEACVLSLGNQGGTTYVLVLDSFLQEREAKSLLPSRNSRLKYEWSRGHQGSHRSKHTPRFHRVCLLAWRWRCFWYEPLTPHSDHDERKFMEGLPLDLSTGSLTAYKQCHSLGHSPPKVFPLLQIWATSAVVPPTKQTTLRLPVVPLALHLLNPILRAAKLAPLYPAAWATRRAVRTQALQELRDLVGHSEVPRMVPLRLEMQRKTMKGRKGSELLRCVETKTQEARYLPLVLS